MVLTGMTSFIRLPVVPLESDVAGELMKTIALQFSQYSIVTGLTLSTIWFYSFLKLSYGKICV